MTHVFGDPSRFRADAMEGFAAAYARYVVRVPDASGFVRSGPVREGKVSLVVGGGSGHYPSYAGLVGPGLAEGCVLGELFASPSAMQVQRVARAADQGGGIVLAFGNYAGDRLNFGVAQERLQAEGIDVRIVYVTDDVASSPSAQADHRRGIAGTFTVYKVGGAAAQRGETLDEVERVMLAANADTFSFGAAFAGCTLPGNREPLFAVEDGRMELGLGIHGEPGVGASERVTADELGRRLVEAVLAERPANSGPHAAVLVNGLGATKYEELFGLYGHVARRLGEAGVVPVLPEVGELVTSLDMAGCSLSVTWLDDELEGLWRDPATTAAFRRVAEDGPPRSFKRPASVTPSATTPETVSASARAGADAVRRILAAMCEVLLARESELGRLDAVAGDGDHGVGMVRGMRAACAAAQVVAGGPGAVLCAAGEAFGDEAGGTSGILWGLILSSIGGSLGDADHVDGARLAAALRVASAAVARVGGARPGDKTLLDALLPLSERFAADVNAGVPAGEAWSAAAGQAITAAAETADWPARVGRARPLGERSVGTPDPGATSLALLADALTPLLAPCLAAGRVHTETPEKE